MTDDHTVSDVDFSYIGDEKARTLIEQFHREAAEAFREKLYIAALVLSGAVLEGILASALAAREPEARHKFRDKYGKNPPDDRPSPGDWYLPELIAIAHSMNLVGESARDAAWAVKDFRNLIHPYKLLSRSPPRWRALAKAALAAIEDIAPSLAGRLGNTGARP